MARLLTVHKVVTALISELPRTNPVSNMIENWKPGCIKVHTATRAQSDMVDATLVYRFNECN